MDRFRGTNQRNAKAADGAARDFPLNIHPFSLFLSLFLSFAPLSTRMLMLESRAFRSRNVPFPTAYLLLLKRLLFLSCLRECKRYKMHLWERREEKSYKFLLVRNLFMQVQINSEIVQFDVKISLIFVFVSNSKLLKNDRS